MLRSDVDEPTLPTPFIEPQQEQQPWKRGLFLFTNRMHKEGKYLSCPKGEYVGQKNLPDVAAVNAAIASEGPLADVYRNSPNAHQAALQNALAVVAKQLSEGDTVVLITKSHGNERHAMVPPLQKTFSAEWFKRYVELIGAQEASSHVASPAGGGSGRDGSETSASERDLGGDDGALSDTDSALGSDEGALGSDEGALGAYEGPLSDVGIGLGDVEIGLGGAGGGLTKEAYVATIKGAELPYSLIFLEACKTDLADELVEELKAARPGVKVWASDNKGLEYRTISNYRRFDTSLSFASNLDDALRAVAAASAP
jgi:hypothetical protein